jgi:hypothetical protein
MSIDSLPLLQHALESPSAFTPERLMNAVRTERGFMNEPVPPLCVLSMATCPTGWRPIERQRR